MRLLVFVVGLLVLSSCAAHEDQYVKLSDDDIAHLKETFSDEEYQVFQKHIVEDGAVKVYNAQDELEEDELYIDPLDEDALAEFLHEVKDEDEERDENDREQTIGKLIDMSSAAKTGKEKEHELVDRAFGNGERNKDHKTESKEETDRHKHDGSEIAEAPCTNGFSFKKLGPKALKWGAVQLLKKTPYYKYYKIAKMGYNLFKKTPWGKKVDKKLRGFLGNMKKKIMGSNLFKKFSKYTKRFNLKKLVGAYTNYKSGNYGKAITNLVGGLGFKNKNINKYVNIYKAFKGGKYFKGIKQLGKVLGVNKYLKRKFGRSKLWKKLSKFGKRFKIGRYLKKFGRGKIWKGIKKFAKGKWGRKIGKWARKFKRFRKWGRKWKRFVRRPNVRRYVRRFRRKIRRFVRRRGIKRFVRKFRRRIRRYTRRFRRFVRRRRVRRFVRRVRRRVRRYTRRIRRFVRRRTVRRFVKRVRRRVRRVYRRVRRVYRRVRRVVRRVTRRRWGGRRRRWGGRRRSYGGRRRGGRRRGGWGK